MGFLSDFEFEEPSSFLGMVGKITNGKLTLNLQDVADSKLFPGTNSGSLSGTLWFTDDAIPPKRIDLSLLKSSTAEGFFMCYLPEEDSEITQGWNLFLVKFTNDNGLGVLNEDEVVHPLQWFNSNGYKWIYNPDPLQGTWICPGDRYVFSGTTYTYTGDGSHPNTSGSFTYTPNTITGTDFLGTTYTIRGNMFWIKNGIYGREIYKRQLP